MDDDSADKVNDREIECRKDDHEMTALVLMGAAGVVATFAFGYLAWGIWGLMIAGAVVFIGSMVGGIATGLG